MCFICMSFIKYVAAQNFLFFRYLKSDRGVILMNICFALTASYIVFLAGIKQTAHKVNMSRDIRFPTLNFLTSVDLDEPV